MRSKRVWLFELARQAYNSGTALARSILSEAPQKTDSENVLERKLWEVTAHNVTATYSCLLKSWAMSSNFSVESFATYDSDGLLVSAAIRWPDGSSGSYTRLVKNGSFPKTDSYAISHADLGLVFTQPTVTRNGSGLVTAAPPIEVTPIPAITLPPFFGSLFL